MKASVLICPIFLAICGCLFCLTTTARADSSALDFDLQASINQEITAGKHRIVIPPGRYRVTPNHGHHLLFKDLTDVEIIADGAEMICTHTISAIAFERCRNVHFKGLTVDYDPLPFTEGRIIALGPDKSWAEFEIIDGYTADNLEERIEIYDPATGELRRETTGWEKTFETVAPRRYRADKHKGYRFQEKQDTEQVGDILVTNNAFPAHAGGHAVSASHCTGLTLEDVTLYGSPCFGFIEDLCDGSTYLRCKIDRRPMGNDPVKRGFARMRSLDADAFHSIEAAKGPAILDCVAKFQGDDCVNIHGTYHMVTGCTGNEVRVAVLRRMTIEVGDPVEFLPYEGKRPDDAVAVKIEPDAPITADEIAFISKLNLNAGNKEMLLGGSAKMLKLTLDRAVPLTAGSAICSGNRVGNGFAVKRCDFGYNRSRGILIKASRGEVSGNTITHGWMAAVLIAPEFWWFEAASSSDVKISGNTIVGCRRPAIEVIAPGGNGKPLPSGAHRNITIEANTITQSVWPNIRVTSTGHLVVKENRLAANPSEQFVPPLTQPWNWSKSKPQAVVTEACDDAEVRGNITGR